VPQTDIGCTEFFRSFILTFRQKELMVRCTTKSLKGFHTYILWMTVTHCMINTRVLNKSESLQNIPITKTNWHHLDYCCCWQPEWHKHQLIILHVRPCVINQDMLLWFTAAHYSLTALQYVTVTTLVTLLVLLHTGVFFTCALLGIVVTSIGIQPKHTNSNAIVHPCRKQFLWLRIRTTIY
jgi:hypothetical protein